MTTKWKRFNSYIQEVQTLIYTSDTGLISDTGIVLGKVNGEWVMENHDGEVIERAKTLTSLKAIYEMWYCE